MCFAPKTRGVSGVGLRPAPRTARLARAVALTLLLTTSSAWAGSGAVAREASVPTATFSHISFSGNTALSTASLDVIASEFVNRAITDDELQALRRRIDEAYAEAGFRTSRATIPNQDLHGGELRIEVIEGGVERIDIEGAKHLDPDYLRARIGAGLGVPLDVERLNDNLRTLLIEQVVKNLRASFQPGSAPGKTRLLVVVEEGPRFGGGLRVANDRSPAAGGVRGAIDVGMQNLIGTGDEVDVTLGKSDGLHDFDIRFRSPLNAFGTELQARWNTYQSTLVEEQFAVLDAETKGHGAELGLSQALWRRAGRVVGMNLRFTSRQSESFLRGEPFSFSPGAENGRLDVKALRLGWSWSERRRQDILSFRQTWSVGLRGLGGTEHFDGLPDSSFHTLITQVQWLHTFGPRAGGLFLRADWQDADQPLLSLEKFGIGGLGSVRGYRRARVVRDNGWTASAEYRLPLFSLSVPGVSKTANDGQVALLAFIDAGRGWNEHDPNDAPRTLLAAGPGLRWDVTRGMRAEVYWAAARRHLAGAANDDIQDQGIHFAITARRGF